MSAEKQLREGVTERTNELTDHLIIIQRNE